METFPIIPGTVRAFWLLVPLVVILAATFGGLAFSLSGARNASFEVSPVGLRLRGDFYGRFIPAADLRLDGARAVDLRAEPALAPRFRTVGTAIKGYQAGWFRLHDGEKALLYITDPSHVAYVPTARGYAVLLSVADPDAFLTSLRKIAP
ncbi:MAG TPA: PH domain-containing protein [Gemmatimonadaceae bacterium]|nr:PH domain-containing protein [Gemmatimonadaceae bacterium]